MNETTDARQRVLDAAERLFAQKGFSSVTLRDIAAEIGIRHTSLYHHAPGGKEQLFVEVTERNFRHHQDGLNAAITNAAPHIRDQLRAVADWLLSQPPMDAVRMLHSDMPLIDPKHAVRLTQLSYDSLLLPVEVAVRAAEQRGEVSHSNPPLIAGAVVGLVESLYSVPDLARQMRNDMAYELIDILLNGIVPR